MLGVVNSEGLHDPGPVRWPLALCLLAAWILIFLCMLKGIRSSGKVTPCGVSVACSHQRTSAAASLTRRCPVCLPQVVYVTATFPYLVLIVLVIRGATLEGSLQGVAFYLTPDWKRLSNAQVRPKYLLKNRRLRISLIICAPDVVTGVERRGLADLLLLGHRRRGAPFHGVLQ